MRKEPANNQPFKVLPLVEQLKCGCENPDLDLMIVPPTWDKSDGHKKLSTVWKKAASDLGSADNIIVIGYSFPKSDVFFHHLYALGSVGEKPLSRFIVINPAKNF